MMNTNKTIGPTLANGLIRQGVRNQENAMKKAVNNLNSAKCKDTLRQHWHLLLEFTFQSYGTLIISHDHGGAKKDQFAKFLCSELLDSGGLEFFTIHLTARDQVIKGKRPTFRVMKPWISRHAVQRLIQHSKETQPNKLGNIFLDHAIAAIENPGVTLTADEYGVVLWAADRDVEERIVATTFVPSNSLDLLQRKYDRLRSGLQVPNAMWIDSLIHKN